MRLAVLGFGLEVSGSPFSDGSHSWLSGYTAHLLRRAPRRCSRWILVGCGGYSGKEMFFVVAVF